MQRWFAAPFVVIATAGSLAVLSLACRPAPDQAQAYRAPRTADGKPDLNGIWQALNTANWDLQDHVAKPGPFPHLVGAIGSVPAGRGVVEGNDIPYQPWALAKKEENFENRMVVDPFELRVGDPEAKCYLPGVPRATYMPFPFQIIQGTQKITMAYEFSYATRVIHMDEVDPSPIDTWMGHSVGRWEEDTLVVDVTSQLDRTWFDRAGNFHSEALHVVERYTPISPYHLRYEAQIEDPNVFTQPWTISLPLYRRIDDDVEIGEFRCAEFTEPFIYGTLSDPPLK